MSGLTLEQLEARYRGIFASEMGDVLHTGDRGGYGCTRRLVYRKRRTAPDFPVEETGPMRRGTDLEEIAARLYVERTGRSVRRVGTRWHKTEPWNGAHADRVIIAGPAAPFSPHPANGIGALELKAPGEIAFRRIRRQGLPEDYIAQLQDQMAVLSAAWGSWGILDIQRWEVLVVDLLRDDELIAGLLTRGAATWKQVQEGPFPDPLEQIGRVCLGCEYRTTCRGAALLELMPEVAGEVEQLEDPELVRLIREHGEVDAAAEEVKELRETLREQIKARLPGPGRRYATPAGRVAWPIVKRQNFNKLKLKAKHPAVDLKDPELYTESVYEALYVRPS